MTLTEQTIASIKPLNYNVMEETKKYWDTLAKPVGSLGKGEALVTQLAGIYNSKDFSLDKKALIVFCADNGVLEEGVASSTAEITAFMAKGFLEKKTAVAIMADEAGVDIFPVDVGMKTDVENVEKRKCAYGTQNMTKRPAMTYENALFAIETGINIAKEKKKEGYDILFTGEMGIGNTTTSTAVTSVILDINAADIVGRGAGLDDEGLKRKTNAVNKAISLNAPDKNDAIDVVSKVGGYDIAAMAGLYLGAASLRMPVVMDGFISAAAALVACSMCEICKDYIIPSHLSEERAMKYIMQKIDKQPIINAGFRLGEGTGAVALSPFLDLMIKVYKKLPVLFPEI